LVDFCGIQPTQLMIKSLCVKLSSSSEERTVIKLSAKNPLLLLKATIGIPVPEKRLSTSLPNIPVDPRTTALSNFNTWNLSPTQ
jgi:hypothetical protein